MKFLLDKKTKVEATKFGKAFKACCPFHKEKTPSLVIEKCEVDDNFSYHCFGCGKDGVARSA